MSKKNLSRSIIEGGKTRWSKYERRYSHKEERSSWRSYAARLKQDPEAAEALVPRKRKKVYEVFDDKLGAMYNWLESRVGRSWDDVYSELKSKFDCRTIAGQHVVYSHLLSEVARHPWDETRRDARFVVDIDGVLKPTECFYNKKRWATGASPWPRRSECEISHWAQGRMVIVAGNELFWASPSKMFWEECKDKYCIREHRDRKRDVNSCTHYASYHLMPRLCHRDHTPDQLVTVTVTYREHLTGGRSYRQGDRFSKEDREFWGTLAPHWRGSLVYEKDSERKEALVKLWKTLGPG